MLYVAYLWVYSVGNTCNSVVSADVSLDWLPCSIFIKCAGHIAGHVANFWFLLQAVRI